ncbi:Uncharacterised protein [Mycobacteroides abscessus subsp. abscessus]|nr:Uncharacterised protein [Mycobacteroides abscessus subsp. abscessus]
MRSPNISLDGAGLTSANSITMSQPLRSSLTGPCGSGPTCCLAAKNRLKPYSTSASSSPPCHQKPVQASGWITAASATARVVTALALIRPKSRSTDVSLAQDANQPEVANRIARARTLSPLRGPIDHRHFRSYPLNRPLGQLL